MTSTATELVIGSDWGKRAQDMPDMCHDFCVKILDLFDAYYFPFLWHEGMAVYQCTHGHMWTCGWGHGRSGQDPSQRGQKGNPA